MIKVSDIKCVQDLTRLGIPKEPGIYKWYIDEDNLKILSDCFNHVVPLNTYVLETTGTLYCIYVGKSNNLQRRIKSHISGKCFVFSKKLGKGCFGSTLRRTLGAILFKRYDEDKINDFINKLYVEWKAVNKLNLDKEEDKEINNPAVDRPLNIDGNKNAKVKDCITYLKSLRKDADCEYKNRIVSVGGTFILTP